MEVQFGAGQIPVAPVAPATPAAPAQSVPLEVVSPVAGLAGQVPAVASFGVPGAASLMLGDKIPDFNDIILPRVNLVHNVGKLKDTFIPGSIVFGQQVELFVPPDIDQATGNVLRKALPPFNMTVIGFRPTRFTEKVSGGARGLTVNTENEVRSNGGTLDYKEHQLKKTSGMRLFQQLSDALVLIERPAHVADDDTVFIYDIEGRKYALALWAMKGTAYTQLAKKIFFTQRAIGCLRGGYPTYSYNISTRLEQYTNPTWIPVGVVREKNSPAFIDFVSHIIGNPSVAKSAPADAAVEGEE